MASFSGGDKLRARLAEMADKLGKASKVQVGFPSAGEGEQGGATYPDGTLVAAVAAYQEYGAPKAKIPPRPFLRPTFASQKNEWADDLSKMIVSSNYDANAALTAVGSEMIGSIQEAIADIDNPALSPITVMLRGMRSNDQSLIVTGATVGEAARRVEQGLTNYGASDKPLVYSGKLMDSIDMVVK